MVSIILQTLQSTQAQIQSRNLRKIQSFVSAVHVAEGE